MRHTTSNQAGFTLVEIVIGMALLASASIVATMSFTSISRLQQHGTAVRGVQQNSRYVLEAIARDIRNATTVCIGSGSGCSTVSGSSGQTVTLADNYLGTQSTITYSFSGNKILRANCIAGVSPCPAAQALASDVIVKSINYMLETVGNRSYVVVDMEVQELAGVTNQSDPYFKDYWLSSVVTPRGQQ